MEEVRLLVARAQAGNREAFGRLVDRFRDMAYGYAFSILGDFHLAEDAAQEAFLQAYRELRALREPSAFPGWLKRIVFTCCGRMTRGKRPATESLSAAAQVPAAGPGPEEMVERRDLTDRVLAAIGALPERERAVTTLFYINGYSHTQIADFLEVPVTTVKSRLHTSRGRLKERMLDMVGDYLESKGLPEGFTQRVLANLPGGRTFGNSYAQGLATQLLYAGVRVDYDMIMGDSGLAFIAQSEEGGPLIDGAVDVGWWPLGTWGVRQRIGFLGRTVGREFRWIEGDPKTYRADPKAHYRARYEAEVKRAIAAGNIVLAETDMCFVVAGYDEGDPPLLGDCPLRERHEVNRIDQYPWGLIVMGEEIPRLSREQADAQALRHAVALGGDEVETTMPPLFSEWSTITARYTGQKSFAYWAALLRDTDHLGQARWHANMAMHLEINRRAAVAYLQAMAERRPAKAATHLRAAADSYAQVASRLEPSDTSEEAMMSRPGREQLARLAESVAQIEAAALREIEAAL